LIFITKEADFMQKIRKLVAAPGRQDRMVIAGHCECKTVSRPTCTWVIQCRGLCGTTWDTTHKLYTSVETGNSHYI